MRNRIRFLLIRLANFIGNSESFDFGEEINGMMKYKKDLVICTKKKIYKFNGKKFTYISGGDNK